jgi:hypothetical protein
VQETLKILKAIGGTPSVESDGGRLNIRSGGRPLVAAVAEHPLKGLLY